MTRGRKAHKRQGLRRRQAELIRAGCGDLSENMIREVVKSEMAAETPQETIAQARHERRVFGHDIGSCSCTSKDVWNLVEWNQPNELWVDGHRLRRRLLNRRGRNHR